MAPGSAAMAVRARATRGRVRACYCRAARSPLSHKGDALFPSFQPDMTGARAGAGCRSARMERSREEEHWAGELGCSWDKDEADGG